MPVLGGGSDGSVGQIRVSNWIWIISDTKQRNMEILVVKNPYMNNIRARAAADLADAAGGSAKQHRY